MWLIPLLAAVASADQATRGLQGAANNRPLAQAGLGPSRIETPHIQWLGGGPTPTPTKTHAAGFRVHRSSNPINLIMGMVGATPGNGAANDRFSGPRLSQVSMKVVGGLVEAFFHKASLLEGEKTCLENNIQAASGNIMGTVGDIVTTAKELVKDKGAPGKKGKAHLTFAAVDAAMQIGSLVTSCMSLLQHCVQGDAHYLLQTANHHLANASYINERLIVNGVDIAHSLSDAVLAFDNHDMRRFGSDIGRALRKILLSTKNIATVLPEGIPPQDIVQEASDGLMKGFFARGSAIRITDKFDKTIDIQIDLHQCIAGNSVMFKQLWFGLWNLFAGMAANAHQHDLGIKRATNYQPKWQGELMIALMQFPAALANCGIDHAMENMFTDAIKSLKDIHVQVAFPHNKRAADYVGDNLAKAVEAWTNWNFEVFGFELGKLLREVVMLSMPQKYSVNEKAAELWREAHEGAGDRIYPSSLVIVGGLSLGAFTSFVIARSRRVVDKRSLSCYDSRESFMSDMEDGAGLEVE